MPTTLQEAVSAYLRSTSPALGTRVEYHTTILKWQEWNNDVPIEQLGRKEIREFLDWVYERAVTDKGSNPGRTTNKAREQLRAIISWAWEHDLIEAPPRFPKPRPQRDVAGRHFLTKAEINALYFATHQMRRPRGWSSSTPVGRFWRCALVLHFNYGIDTGTLWEATPSHEPILWRHVCWGHQSPDSNFKQRSRWGWLFYRRVKTGKVFYRPMNRIVHAHIKSIMLADPGLNEPVLRGGGARPNARFAELCKLAHIQPKRNIDSGTSEIWELKDLRKTCATYYDEHMPESSIEILAIRWQVLLIVITLIVPRWRSRQSCHYRSQRRSQRLSKDQRESARVADGHLLILRR